MAKKIEPISKDEWTDEDIQRLKKRKKQSLFPDRVEGIIGELEEVFTDQEATDQERTEALEQFAYFMYGTMKYGIASEHGMDGIPIDIENLMDRHTRGYFKGMKSALDHANEYDVAVSRIKSASGKNGGIRSGEVRNTNKNNEASASNNETYDSQNEAYASNDEAEGSICLKNETRTITRTRTRTKELEDNIYTKNNSPESDQGITLPETDHTEPEQPEQLLEEQPVPEEQEVPEQKKKGRKKKSEEVRHRYGEYNNVLLSDQDLEKLKAEYPDTWEYWIDKVSGYCKQHGKTYSDYLATIRNWARNDRNSGNNSGNRNFKPHGTDTNNQYKPKDRGAINDGFEEFL